MSSIRTACSARKSSDRGTGRGVRASRPSCECCRSNPSPSRLTDRLKVVRSFLSCLLLLATLTVLVGCEDVPDNELTGDQVAVPPAPVLNESPRVGHLADRKSTRLNS